MDFLSKEAQWASKEELTELALVMKKLCDQVERLTEFVTKQNANK